MPTTPKFGPLSDQLAIVVARVVATAAMQHLPALNCLDEQVPGATGDSFAVRWMTLQRELYSPVAIAIPPLPPTADEIAAAVAGASESERITVLQILVEVGAFLCNAGLEIVSRVKALPSSEQALEWGSAVAAAVAAGGSLWVAHPSVKEAAAGPALTSTLVALAQS